MKREILHFSEIQVRFNEADPLGIVWHGHYIQYFEDGRESFGKQFGISYLDVYKNGFTTPIVKVVCDYKKPLRYGDTILIETKYIPSDAAKLEFTYKLFKKESGELVATGSTTQIFLDKVHSELQLFNPPFFLEWKKDNDCV